MEEKEAIVATEENSIADLQKKEQRAEKRMKRRSFLKGFFCAILLMVLCLGAGALWYTSSAYERVLDAATVAKIETLGAYIQMAYYEDVDVDELRDGLFDGLFANLDAYSLYYTQEEYENLLESSLEGTYCGIGASLQQDTDTMQVTIVRVYADSPAEEAGLLAGDVIYKVDDYEATSMELSELVLHIRGEENTSVHLITYRDGALIEYDIERKNLTYPTVAYDMLEGNIGYIAVSEFAETTTGAFEEALAALEEEGMTGLIVDLRSNPGGVLSTVCDMLDFILPEGLILYTENRDGDRTEYNTTDATSLEVPLVVLVNGSSASASEIFAGAVQAREAGTILGTTTYGKGVVQSIRTLTDGTAFKLTTHKYYTPAGVCIQGIGITPDVELSYEFLGGEEDAYSYDLDNQIQAALKLLQQ